MRFFILKTLACFFLLGSLAQASTVLTLEEYVKQVQATGPSYLQGITSSKVNSLARISIGKHWSANLNLSATGGGSYDDYDYNYVYLGGINTNPGSYQYFNKDLTEYVNGNANLNLNNNWDFGLSTSFYDNFQTSNQWPMWNNQWGTNIYNNSGDNFGLNVSIPLWQNFLGRSIHAQDQTNFLNNDANAANDEFNIQSSLYSAKLAYFNLALVRTELIFALETLQKFHGLLEWAQGRHDPQDVIQAQTALENEHLTIESLEDAERADRNSFNLLRAMKGSEVKEDLMSLAELNAAVNEPWDPKDPDRQDLKASRLQLEAARENLIVNEENTKLNLALSGSLNGNMLSNDFGYPAPPPLTFPNVQSYSVGLSLSVPFDIFTPLWDASYKETKLNLEQQKINLSETENSDSQQWEDMTIRFNKSSDRVATATSLVDHSKVKRDQGEELLKKGRIDMFETLSFVTSYYSAVVTLQTWLNQRLSLLAQADWYRAQPGLWKKAQEQ